MKVVSTFSGAGGSCLGYTYAGYDVVWANEFIPDAAATYRANHNTPLDTRDIRDIATDSVCAATGLHHRQIDLLDGSPPCASFSMGGSRQNHWGQEANYSGTRQRTDDLFEQYIRFVHDLQPKTFVAENVPGLVSGTAIGYFKNIRQSLMDCGYKVSACIVDASRLGVPQRRKRLIIVGVRHDLGLDPTFPTPGRRHIMSEVLGPHAVIWVNSPRTGNLDWEPHPANEPSPTVQARGMAGRHRRQILLTGVDEIDADPETGWPLRLDTPEAIAFKPRTYKRMPTLGELRALCGFPGDYILTGSYSKRWERLGRAVPPPMMQAIATTIKEDILCAVS